jgi:hypothetical protein
VTLPPGRARLATRPSAELGERPLVLDGAVGLNVIGEHRRADGVVDDQGLAVIGQREAVRARHRAVDQHRLLGAGREVIHIGRAPRHHRPRAGIGEVDAALGIDSEAKDTLASLFFEATTLAAAPDARAPDQGDELFAAENADESGLFIKCSPPC